MHRAEAQKGGAWDARSRALNQKADSVEAEAATWQLLMQLHGEQSPRWAHLYQPVLLTQSAPASVIAVPWQSHKQASTQTFASRVGLH